VLRTQRKLTAIFALAGSVTVLIGILSYNSVSRLRLDAQWVSHTHDVVAELHAIDASFVVAETSGATAAQLETRDHLRAVHELTADNPEQQTRVIVLDTLIERAFADTSRPRPAALRHERRAVREMVQEEQALLDDRTEQTARSSSFALIAITLGSALAVAIAIGAQVFVHRDFARAQRAELALRYLNTTLDERVTARTRELQHVNRRLESAFNEWRTLVCQAPLAMAMLDRKMRYIAASGRWVQEFARGNSELAGLCHYDVHPDIPDRWREVHRRALAGELLKCDEELWLHSDGSQQWLSWAVSPWRNEAGEIGGVMIIVDDVTPRKRAEQRARLAHAVFESMQEGLFITDLSGRMIAVNPAFRAIMEYNDAELIGQHLGMLRSSRHDPEFYDSIWQNLRHAGHWRGEVWNRRKSGEVSPQWIGISTVRDEYGEPQYYVGVCADIGRMQHATSHLQYLAHHDSLTGLANRSLLALRLRHTIERARRDSGRCAVLYLDLDGFKVVNDSLGHDAGDDLLRRVARRMSRRLRDIDTLARLGGDEFVLVLEHLSNDADAEDVARSLISRLTRWFRLSDGSKVSVGVSIGISVYPSDGEDAETLLRRADVALYRAKSAGRGTLKFAHEIVVPASTES
jgi:diguanylate cyclase (GGDEF)-like protein/PAS domain S-box-containing protein